MKSSIIFTLIFFTIIANSQITPPYKQDFETGIYPWEIHTISGKHFWMQGIPGVDYYEFAHSKQNALNVHYPVYAEETDPKTHIAITPAFDFSFMPEELFLTYYQVFNYVNEAKILVEYNTDGKQWNILFDEETDPVNWPRRDYITESGRTAIYANGNADPISHYGYCAHSLSFLEGNQSVRFRYRFYTPRDQDEFYSIDDFSIDVAKPNIIAFNSPSVFSVTHSDQPITVSIPIRVIRYDNNFTWHDIQYFLSKDTILDVTDVLLFTENKQISYSSTLTFFFEEDGFLLPENCNEGIYYIIYDIQANPDFPEICSDDNKGYMKLSYYESIDLPVCDKVIDSISYFYTENTHTQDVWKKGIPDTDLFLPYSNDLCWFQAITNNFGEYREIYLKSFVLNIPPDSDSIYCSFRYINSNDDLKLSLFADGHDIHYDNLENTNYSDWQHGLYNISSLISQTNPQVVFRYSSVSPYYISKAIDDIYIGGAKPDLVLTSKPVTYAPKEVDTVNFHYILNNTGPIETNNSVSKFYYSEDPILDSSDVLIAEINESILQAESSVDNSFQYTKQKDVKQYYILYQLDAYNNNTEMWEHNNTGAIEVNSIHIFIDEYTEDFELGCFGWFEEDSAGKLDFERVNLNSYSDRKYDGNWAMIYTGYETYVNNSYLYSPMFDLRKFTTPVISFDSYIEGHEIFIEYSINGGVSWNVLQPFNNSFEFYHTNYYTEYYQPSGSDEKFDLYSKFRDNTISYDISDLKPGIIQFRFRGADLYNYELQTIDNFSITEGTQKSTVEFLSMTPDPAESNKFNFNYEIRNYDLLCLDSLNVSLYVSKDSLFDISDTLLSNLIISHLLPGTRYLYEGSQTIDSLEFYSHCILIAKDKTGEGDSIVQALFPKPIDSFPYIEPFNTNDPSGWYSSSSLADYKIRLQPQPEDESTSFYWITDYLPYGKNPICKLRSPAFNFSACDSVFLFFKLRSRGGSSTTELGGNMKYSIDKGQTWNLLGVRRDSLGVNWYDLDSNQYREEPLWNDGHDYLLRAYNATDLLAGQPDVMFMFINDYHPFDYEKSFIMDDFVIANTTERSSLKINVPPVTYLPINEYPVYSIIEVINDGYFPANNYEISTYISYDTILDENDLPLGGGYGPVIYPNDSILIKLRSESYIYCDQNRYVIFKLRNNPTETNLLPTVYCDSITQWSILEYLPYKIQIREFEEDSIFICNNELVFLSVDSLYNFSYKWSDGSLRSRTMVSHEGLYKIEVFYSYCLLTSDSIYIGYYDSHSESPLYDISSRLDTLYLSSQNNTNVYWSSGDTSCSIITNPNTYYFYFYTDSSGCSNRSESVYNLQHDDDIQELLHCEDTLFCEGDSLRLVSVPGNSYTWSTGDTTRFIFVNEAGEFWCKTDFSSIQTTSDTVEIQELDYPSKTITLDSESICKGDSTIFRAEYRPGFSYLWSNGLTTSGIPVYDTNKYSAVVVNTNRCSTQSDTVSVGYYPLPETPELFQNGINLIVNDEYSHVWYLKGDSIFSNTDTVFHPPYEGSYTVESINEYGCRKESNEVEYIFPVPSNEFHVAPNPSNDHIIIYFALDAETEVCFRINSINGHEIYSKTEVYPIGNNYMYLESSKIYIPVGVSILTVIVDKKIVESIKIIRIP